MIATHGKDCDKVSHYGKQGLLHAGDDDGPYDVDGVKYCGRCHFSMDIPVHRSVRISYDAYSFISDLFKKQKEQLQSDYTKTILFLRKEDSAQDAHFNYMAALKVIRNHETEFQNTAREGYRNHPDPEMRRFWGVDSEND